MYKKLLDMKNIAVMLGGLPGSGKSTIANKFINNNFLCICKDTIRYELARRKYGNKPETLLDEHLQKFNRDVHPIIESMIQSYFGKKADTTVIETKMSMQNQMYAIDYINSIDFSNFNGIVFDATYFNSKQRKAEILRIDKRLPMYCIYVNKTVDECYAGVEKRAATIVGMYNGKKVYGRHVPKEVIECMKKFESLPKISEGFEKVFIIENKF